MRWLSFKGCVRPHMTCDSIGSASSKGRPPVRADEMPNVQAANRARDLVRHTRDSAASNRVGKQVGLDTNQLDALQP